MFKADIFKNFSVHILQVKWALWGRGEYFIDIPVYF